MKATHGVTKAENPALLQDFLYFVTAAAMFCSNKTGEAGSGKIFCRKFIHDHKEQAA